MFDDFWKVYPKKRARVVAEKAWMRLKLSDEEAVQVIEKVKEFCRSDDWQRDGGQYIPYPATFLNQQRWEDEMEVAVKKSEERARPLPELVVADADWARRYDEQQARKMRR